MSTYYLIRHGKTEANERRLYCGSTDLSLTDGGIRELKKRHYRINHARFLTSGMRRTEQTLEILFGQVPHERDPQLREMDFGQFEMHSYEELKENPAYQAWLAGENETNPTPGGESGAQMQKRVWEAFSRWRADGGESTVIITHGGVIASLMARLFPEENKNRYQWQPAPGCGYAVVETEDGSGRAGTLRYFLLPEDFTDAPAEEKA